MRGQAQIRGVQFARDIESCHSVVRCGQEFALTIDKDKPADGVIERLTICIATDRLALPVRVKFGIAHLAITVARPVPRTAASVRISPPHSAFRRPARETRGLAEAARRVGHDGRGSNRRVDLSIGNCPSPNCWGDDALRPIGQLSD
jgi:hypothetical protein